MGVPVKRLVWTSVRKYSAKTSSTLKKPQYDFKRLRSETDALQDSVVRREVKLANEETVHNVAEKYKILVDSQQSRNELVHQRNIIQKDLERRAKQKKDISVLKDQLMALKKEIKAAETTINELETPVMEAIESIPNLISPEAVDLLNVEELDVLNPEAKLPADPDRDHLDIGLKLNIIDLESASKVSGSSWYYLVNDGAMLEQALVQYGLSMARKNGFAPMLPPSIVRLEMTSACGFKPRDQNNEQQVYVLENSNLCLAGTAEIPMAGWAAQKTLDLSNGPIQKVGLSRSYRAEAGAGGRDTKGLYRVHEFTKVELFAWTKGNLEESVKMHDKMLALQKEIITSLGLCARVLNMPPNDLGASAYKKYDIEAWMPGRGDWGEVTSTSNCLDYQSRRMHTKYEVQDGTSQFAYTLNGTAVAVPRLIVAILENFYEPEYNRVRIPEPLRKWMDDKEYIE
ncbi:serine--tRNA ligase, mitochondrial [Trichomonascus vanleenenianus]|uniref:putative serine--tRNA ligase DIA4 n=1 Tax=Trichomonascus vanleenenianus TaxID=2268995 RepID=UPI003EC9F575